jgi:hypothetical protein
MDVCVCSSNDALYICELRMRSAEEDTAEWKAGLRVVSSCSVIYSMRKYDMLILT